jgi:hypothetical protein
VIFALFRCASFELFHGKRPGHHGLVPATHSERRRG